MKILPAVVLVLLLAACGQTGSLRLPEPKAAPASTPAPVADDAAEKPKTPPTP